MKTDEEFIKDVLGAIFGKAWPMIKGHPNIRKVLEGIEMGVHADPGGIDAMRDRLREVVNTDVNAAVR